MARIIPALCPQCGGNLTLNPAAEWVTCSFCKATSFIETPARRHAPNHPPVHVPVIQVPEPSESEKRRNTILSVGFITLMFASHFLLRLDCGGVGGLLGGDDAAPDEPPAAQSATHDYHRDARPLRMVIDRGVGEDVGLLGAVVHPTSATVDVCTSSWWETTCERVVIKVGRVWERSPIPARNEEAEGRLVPASRLELVPSLIADARARLALAGARVTSVALGASPPASVALQWRVSMANDRNEQGTAAYDPNGQFQQVIR